MRKTTAYIFAFAVGIAALGLTSLSARAATLLVEDGELIGANGVSVNGSLFDVRFEDGTCQSLFNGCDSLADLAFTDEASSRAAGIALLDQVFLDGPLGNFDTIPSLTRGCSDPIYCAPVVPFIIFEGGGAFGIGVLNGPEVFDGVNSLAHYASPGSDTSSLPLRTFAVFTPAAAAVPTVSTLLLFGVGLAGLTAAGRRRRG